MRDSILIYRSFYDAIKELPKENQLNLWTAIFEYAMNEKTTELQGIEKTVFTLIKPNLDANNKKYENGKKGSEYGKKGGRPKKEKTPKKPQENPSGVIDENPKETPNVEEDKECIMNKEEEKKELKEKYLDFVFLTKNEYTKLLEKFGEIKTKEYIEKLNVYIGSKGKKYKSHYFTILNWENKEKNDPIGKPFIV